MSTVRLSDKRARELLFALYDAVLDQVRDDVWDKGKLHEILIEVGESEAEPRGES